MQTPTPDQNRVSISLRTADRDMETAEALTNNAPHLHESVGFSCQQAVEKYLKAVLVASGLPCPFIHDLPKLMASLQQAQIVVFDASELQQAIALTEFAVGLRYEVDEAPSFTAADLLAMAYRFRNKLRPLALAFLS